MNTNLQVKLVKRLIMLLFKVLEGLIKQLTVTFFTGCRLKTLKTLICVGLCYKFVRTFTLNISRSQNLFQCKTLTNSTFIK